MAYVSSELSLPFRPALRRSLSGTLAGFGGAIVKPFRRRWIYHRTLSDLQGYSKRDLADIGVTHGIHEFARRAAGL